MHCPEEKKHDLIYQITLQGKVGLFYEEWNVCLTCRNKFQESEESNLCKSSTLLRLGY